MLGTAIGHLKNSSVRAVFGVYFSMREFSRTDYSVVVKQRNIPPNSWRWEIHRAGRSSPIKHSLAPFRTMVAANRAGKEALKQLLDKLYS